jgi:hypothetical protein
MDNPASITIKDGMLSTKQGTWRVSEISSVEIQSAFSGCIYGLKIMTPLPLAVLISKLLAMGELSALVLLYIPAALIGLTGTTKVFVTIHGQKTQVWSGFAFMLAHERAEANARSVKEQIEEAMSVKRSSTP